MLLLVTIDLLTGEAILLINPSHKSPDFVSFLKILDKKYPVNNKIRIILDNHSAYISRDTQKYLNIKSVSFIYQYFDEINKVPVNIISRINLII